MSHHLVKDSQQFYICSIYNCFSNPLGAKLKIVVCNLLDINYFNKIKDVNNIWVFRLLNPWPKTYNKQCNTVLPIPDQTPPLKCGVWSGIACLLSRLHAQSHMAVKRLTISFLLIINYMQQFDTCKIYSVENVVCYIGAKKRLCGVKGQINNQSAFHDDYYCKQLVSGPDADVSLNQNIA